MPEQSQPLLPNQLGESMAVHHAAEPRLPTTPEVQRQLDEPECLGCAPPQRESAFSVSMRQHSAEIQAARKRSRTSSTELMETRSPPRLLAFSDDPRVFVYRDLVNLFGPNEGLLLSQLVYWFRRPKGDSRPRARAIAKDGYRWLEKSGKALSDETGLPIRTTQRTLASLKRRGLIEQQARRLRLTSACSNIAILGNGMRLYAATVRMTGDAAAAIILSQLCCWSDTDNRGRCRLRVRKNDHLWLAKSYHGLASETGLSVQRCRRAVQRLVAQGLVIKDHFLFAGIRTLHLRLDTEVFADTCVNAVIQ